MFWLLVDTRWWTVCSVAIGLGRLDTLVTSVPYWHIMGIKVFLTPSYYNDVIMGAMALQERKHQSSMSLAFGRGIHRCPVNFPHKGPVTRKMFPFDDDIMTYRYPYWIPTKEPHTSYTNISYMANVTKRSDMAIILPDLIFMTNR